MKLVLLGPPGAGKGTLATLLKESLNILHISTGDILREEMKNGTELGKEAKKFIDNGELVPDEVVTRLVESKFTSDKNLANGFMLDGFPRTKAQAEDLDKILKKAGLPLDTAVYMETDVPLIIKRLTGRRVCRSCGAVFHVENRPWSKEKCPKDGSQCDMYQRADDNEETIRTRMDVYLKNTLPIVEYYESQKRLTRLDGNKESEELQRILVKIFNED